MCYYKIVALKRILSNKLRCGKLIDRADPLHKLDLGVDLKVFGVVLQNLTRWCAC